MSKFNLSIRTIYLAVAKFGSFTAWKQSYRIHQHRRDQDREQVLNISIVPKLCHHVAAHNLLELYTIDIQLIAQRLVAYFFCSLANALSATFMIHVLFDTRFYD